MPKGKSENTKQDVHAAPEVDDKYILAIFKSIDSLPPNYLIKLKNLRVAVQGLNMYRTKIRQEVNYRKNMGEFPDQVKKKVEPKVYDEKTKDNTPEDLKGGE
jgi:hypothetical protein